LRSATMLLLSRSQILMDVSVPVNRCELSIKRGTRGKENGMWRIRGESGRKYLRRASICWERK
jgi:hypothetical protein